MQAARLTPPASATNNPFDPLAEIAGLPADAGSSAAVQSASPSSSPITGGKHAPSATTLSHPPAATAPRAATFDAPTASRVAHVKAVMGVSHPTPLAAQQTPFHNAHHQQFHYHAHLQLQHQQHQQQQLLAYNQAMQAQQQHLSNAHNTVAQQQQQQLQAYQTVVLHQQHQQLQQYQQQSTAPSLAPQTHALVVHGQHTNAASNYNPYANTNAFATQQQQQQQQLQQQQQKMLQLQLLQQRAAATASNALVPVMQAERADGAAKASDFRVQRRKPTHVSEDDCAFRPLVDMLMDGIKTGAQTAKQQKTGR